MLNFNQFLHFIKKKTGLNVLLNKNQTKSSFISSGILSLDLMTGIEGIPLGRIVEIFGPESTGKTTFCLNMLRYSQILKKRIVYIDMEHSLNIKFVKKLGLNLSNFILVKPEFAEEALNVIELFIKSNFINLIVVDSVAALVPRVEFKNNFNGLTIGLQARLMSQAMRKLVPILERFKCTLIFINQIRDRINTYFSSNLESTPGGRALKFSSSIRIELRKKLNLKDADNNSVGVCIAAKSIKNKLSTPNKTCTFNLFFKEARLSSIDFIITLSLQKNILKKLKSKFVMHKNIVGSNQTNVRIFLKLNLNLLDKVVFLLKKYNK
ncbi:DNA recombination/repair protein RecA [Candidatus Pinguicoccus supinus]|uniref:Protein RecA n=1 Tax=Candidatus Pinguicoccus supinus TaxID=2529394 RepID=A0A7T0BSD0_9BACT|nr:DNA recombination/repair protein RecA [Candidatus Pinguicoccus supinus]